MPARITVRLEPTVAGAFPLPQTGPAVNGAVLAAVGGVEPGLARGMHDSRAFKPFTITPLLDEHDRPVGRHSREARFAVGALVDELTAPVLTGLGSREEYRIGTTRYRVKEVVAGPVETYEVLAARARPVSGWTFRLLTPTGFARAADQGARRELPWPDPARVFGNLADRWEALGPRVPLPQGLEAAVRAHLVVSGYELQTGDHLVKVGVPPRLGAVGRITYRVAEARSLAPEVRAALDALARYADYAGFGDRTAMGMGVARRVEA